MFAPRAIRAGLGLLAATTAATALLAPTASAAPAKNATTMHVTVLKHDLRAYFGWSGTVRPTGEFHFFVDAKQVGTLTVPDYSPSGVPLNGYKVIAQLPYTIPSGSTHQVKILYTGDSAFSAVAQSATRMDPRISVHSVSAAKVTRFGWYRDPVTVTFTCKATTAKVTCPKSTRFTKSNANQFAVGIATAGDGGRKSVVKMVNLDRVAPRVSIGTANGSRTYQCSDALSGIAHCTLSRFAKSGANYYRVTAVDKAGNAKVVTGRL